MANRDFSQAFVAPKYSKIMIYIQANIDDGVWQPGDKLPSEQEIANSFQVSRETVRAAMNRLAQGGLIYRLQGKGTFVSAVGKTSSKIKGFSQLISEKGLKPWRKILAAKMITVDAARGRVKEAFEVARGTEIILIKRVMGVYNVPWAIHWTYLLPSQCPGILEEDLTELFRIYDKLGRQIIAANEKLRVSVVSAEDAGHLEVEAGTPVAIRDRISYDQDHQPFEVLHAVDVGGRFEYEYSLVK